MLILPAIDLLDGECVRLKQGDYSEKTTYGVDPLAVAKGFEDQGATWLHVVDLNGARDGALTNLKHLERIARGSRLKIEFGGGIRSKQAAQVALDAGVERVVIGSKIIQDPDLAEELFEELGEQVAAGLDARGGLVATVGWLSTSASPVEEVAKWVESHGGRRIILTDISKDGMLQGPNLDLLKRVLDVTEIPVIQSGGVTTLEQIQSLVGLAARGPEGVIIGKAIYENRLDLGSAVRQFQAIQTPIHSN